MEKGIKKGLSSKCTVEKQKLGHWHLWVGTDMLCHYQLLLSFAIKQLPFSHGTTDWLCPSADSCQRVSLAQQCPITGPTTVLCPNDFPQDYSSMCDNYCESCCDESDVGGSASRSLWTRDVLAFWPPPPLAFCSASLANSFIFSWNDSLAPSLCCELPTRFSCSACSIRLCRGSL